MFICLFWPLFTSLWKILHSSTATLDWRIIQWKVKKPVYCMISLIWQRYWIRELQEYQYSLIFLKLQTCSYFIFS